ncbi:MAG: hypothetical protein DMG27_20545 [Acidobacteria bacterium]|nr:MAG: hypothetical protein DMG27_20545 [Acidobacteriota bacterium]
MVKTRQILRSPHRPLYQRGPVKLGREDQLCLLLLRSELSPDAERQALELLASPLGWQLVLERARTHEVLPLLYRNLEALGFAGMPEPARAELADAYGNNAIRNVLLAKELARVLAQLGEAGVPVMPLKGAALAESLYGDPALRVSADMDILVPPKYFVEAFRLMVSSGYQSRFTPPPLLELLARYGKDCALVREDRACVYPLQLHCGLVWGGPVERDLLGQIWSEAVRKTFHGVPAFALSADWEFLYLAVHAARHSLTPLKWLVDLDRLCSSGTVDWEKAKEKARRLGWEGAVQSSLATCAALLDTSVPPLFSGPLFPGNDSRPPHSLHVPRRTALQIPREVIFGARLLKSRSQKLRFLAARLFIPTSADCRLLPLPSSLFFLYYPLRPLRVACTVAAWLAQAGVENLRRALRHRTGTD